MSTGPDTQAATFMWHGKSINDLDLHECRRALRAITEDDTYQQQVYDRATRAETRAKELQDALERLQQKYHTLLLQHTLTLESRP